LPRVGGLKDVTMARRIRRRFRYDVVRVARNREDCVTIEQIGRRRRGGPHDMSKWLPRPISTTGAPGKTTVESAELRYATCRTVADQENEFSAPPAA